jgi:hypothetical protein
MDKRPQRCMRLLMTATLATIGLVLAGWTSFGPPSLQGGAPAQSGVPTPTPASSGPPKRAPRTGQPNVAAQRAAMSKLGFLIGQWSGPLMLQSGPGSALHFVQSENVQPKVDGLVVLVEGVARASSGHAVFQALATISYDDVTATYRFRAYNDGRYLDTTLRVSGQGFSWGYTAGPATITNTMRLTPAGAWSEQTTTRVGTAPPRTTVEMTLHRI